MEGLTKLTRKAYRVGNSAGVVVPKEWLNGFVEVKLIELPLRTNSGYILEILEKAGIDTSEILGIAIIGSYARNEQDKESDIDILVITNNLNKKIRAGRYEIIIISEKILEKQLNDIGFPILPMILEAVPIINKNLFVEYKKNTLSKKALKWLVDTTNSSMKISKEQISILKEFKERDLSDNISYSLILRLRTLYMINSLLKGWVWSKKDFLNLINDIAGSLISYEGYLRVKNNKKIKKELKIKEAERLTEYIMEKTKMLKNG